MTTFTLTIDCGNAAFDPAPDYELARILRSMADRLEGLYLDADTTIKLYDINGNHCGTAKFDTEGE